MSLANCNEDWRMEKFVDVSGLWQQRNSTQAEATEI
jgi:hypothetical protein